MCHKATSRVFKRAGLLPLACGSHVQEGEETEWVTMLGSRLGGWELQIQGLGVAVVVN